MTDPTSTPPRTSPRDIILRVLGFLGPPALWWASAWGLPHMSDTMYPIVFSLILSAAYYLLPWVPIAIAIGLSRDPLRCRFLPIVAFLSLSMSTLAQLVYHLGGMGNITDVTLVTWVVTLINITLPVGAGAIAMGLWIRLRIETPKTPEIPDTQNRPPRDILSVLLAVFGPIGSHAIMIWGMALISYLEIPRAPYIEVIHLCVTVWGIVPWVLVILAIRLARRPSVCHNIPIIAFIVVASVLVLINILSFRTLAYRFGTGPAFMVAWTALTRHLLRAILPMLALILWARRRARTLPDLPRFYYSGFLAPWIAAILTPIAAAWCMYYLNDETRVYRWDDRYRVLLGAGIAFFPLFITLITGRIARGRLLLHKAIIVAILVNLPIGLAVLGFLVMDDFDNDSLTLALICFGESLLFLRLAAAFFPRPPVTA
jgi:hypothetical protein